MYVVNVDTCCCVKQLQVDEQQPSSTARNGDSPAAPRCKGLRDLKIVGEVSNEWSSDESDEFPAKLGR